MCSRTRLSIHYLSLKFSDVRHLAEAAATAKFFRNLSAERERHQPGTLSQQRGGRVSWLQALDPPAAAVAGGNDIIIETGTLSRDHGRSRRRLSNGPAAGSWFGVWHGGAETTSRDGKYLHPSATLSVP